MAAMGARVLILEKNNRAGRKLAITGKGRCNVTNASEMREMQEQIKAYGLEDTKSFRFFLGKSAYFTSMFLDKNYHRINDNAKRNHVQYLSIMRKNYWHYVPSKRVKLKDKLLYTMIVTRTMRPIYKILGKQ